MNGSPDSGWLPVFGAWVVASAATLGALFFSEVMAVPPCVLCWYQRIFMFPLVVILPLGLFPFDRKVVRYALPLAFGGWLVSVFHVLVWAGVVPEDLKPCTQGVPCAEVHFRWLGFIDIPILSLFAFTTLCALLLVAHLRSDR